MTLSPLEPMRMELAIILRVGIADIPAVFKRLRILKIGIYFDLLARHPDADRTALDDWLRRYTGRADYIRRVVRCRHRHDLDGNDVAAIDYHSKERAHTRLADLREQEAA